MEQPAPLSQRLFACQKPADVRISPAAQSPRQIVYQTSRYGRKGENTTSTLWLAEHGVEHSARPLTSGLYNDRAPRWTSDGKSIIFISDRAKPSTSCALYCLNLNGGEPFPLTPVENEQDIDSFEIDPRAGNFVAYLSPDEDSAEKKSKNESGDDADVEGQHLPFNRLRLLHLASRSVQTLFAQDKHVSAFVWTRDASCIVVTSREIPSLDHATSRFSLLDLSRRQVSDICDFPMEIQSDLITTPRGVIFTGGVSQLTTTTSACLYELDIEAKNWTRADAMDSVCTSAISGTPSATCILHASHEKSIFNVRAANESGEVAKPAASFTYKSPHSVAAAQWALTSSEDDKQCLGVLVVNSPGSATEVISLSQCAGASPDEWTATKLSTHGASIHQDLPDTYLEVCASPPNGPRGLLLTPQGIKTPQNLPCVVYIHGGPYFRTTASFDPTDKGWTPLLRSAGYAVLFPNYSGSSGRGEAWAKRASHGVGTVEYDDVLAITEAAIANGWIDKTRLVVGGWSQGGFLSYLCATRSGTGLRFSRPLDGDGAATTTSHNEGPPDWRFKGAICGAGVVDWDMMTMSSDVPRFESDMSGSVPWAMAKTDVAGRQGSAVWEMADARAEDVPPILILHGKEDVRVPWTQALAYSRACKAKGVPCEFVTYPREGHLFRERAHLVDMAERVLRFVQSKIG